jgi:alkaline phosphatase
MIVSRDDDLPPQPAMPDSTTRPGAGVQPPAAHRSATGHSGAFGAGTWWAAGVIVAATTALVASRWVGAPRTVSDVAALDQVGRVDWIRDMEVEAERMGRASWGHWGDQPERYAAWSNHSNRMIPVYTFGITLDDVRGERSVYRDAGRLEPLYGRLPDATVNPEAEYFDQTDVYRLMLAAAESGKRRIVLFVFDGMDWHTTRVAAIAAAGRVGYREGRGSGLAIQDYRGAPTDFGWFVTSPANDGTTFDVDAQAIKNPGGTTAGGYDPALGGGTPWDPRHDLRYLIGKNRERPHAVTDSAASATSLCSGRKTYNDSINVGPAGELFEPIARTLQARGWAVGAVTSVPVSHATPGCSYANNVSRGDYQDISRDLLGMPSVAHRGGPLPGLDVLIGTGWGVESKEDADQGRNYEPGNKYVAESTLAGIDLAAGGRYRVVQRTSGRRGDELLAEAAAEAIDRGTRLFGYFGTAEGNLPFRTADGDFDPSASPADDEADRLRKKYGGAIRYTPADLAENPTLADMAVAALDVLESRGSFWLMVEAGDVDWACHANNIDTCIGAIHSGDDAFRAVCRWIEARDGWDDTAVIVTSDHGHLFVLTEPEAFAGPGR